MVSHYQENPRMMHWKTIKRIFRYLIGIVDYSFCYQGKELLSVGYSHAVWISDLDEHKSTSGYLLLLNNGVISWRSKKRTSIALSTMETKFIVCSAIV